MTPSQSIDRKTARRALAVVVAVAALAAVAACAPRSASRSGLFQPYRTDLPQGNYLTQAMVDQVKPGMTREQVKFALGAPLLTPVFRVDRWDYVFRYQRADGSSELRRVIVRFSDERVSEVRAVDELPASSDAGDPALPGYRAPGQPEAKK